MSGMDRLTEAELLERAAWPNALAEARMAREILAHRRASQAAPAPSDGLREANERPDGAMHNGRCFMDRIEADYSFECVAGPISNCADWHELRRCFEHMASYIAALTPAPAQEGGE